MRAARPTQVLGTNVGAAFSGLFSPDAVQPPAAGGGCAPGYSPMTVLNWFQSSSDSVPWSAPTPRSALRRPFLRLASAQASAPPRPSAFRSSQPAAAHALAADEAQGPTRRILPVLSVRQCAYDGAAPALSRYVSIVTRNFAFLNISGTNPMSLGITTLGSFDSTQVDGLNSINPGACLNPEP